MVFEKISCCPLPKVVLIKYRYLVFFTHPLIRVVNLSQGVTNQGLSNSSDKALKAKAHQIFHQEPKKIYSIFFTRVFPYKLFTVILLSKKKNSLINSSTEKIFILTFFEKFTSCTVL